MINGELELENYNWLINDPLGNNGIKADKINDALEGLGTARLTHGLINIFTIILNGTGCRLCVNPPIPCYAYCRL